MKILIPKSGDSWQLGKSSDHTRPWKTKLLVNSIKFIDWDDVMKIKYKDWFNFILRSVN